VIHWKGYHWVVLYGRRRKYVIADPASYLDRQERQLEWNYAFARASFRALFEQPQTDSVDGFDAFFRIWPYRALLTEALLINIVPGPTLVAP